MSVRLPILEQFQNCQNCQARCADCDRSRLRTERGGTSVGRAALLPQAPNANEDLPFKCVDLCGRPSAKASRYVVLWTSFDRVQGPAVPGRRRSGYSCHAMPGLALPLARCRCTTMECARSAWPTLIRLPSFATKQGHFRWLACSTRLDLCSFCLLAILARTSRPLDRLLQPPLAIARPRSLALSPRLHPSAQAAFHPRSDLRPSLWVLTFNISS